MTQESQALKEADLRERRKAEYDRWFVRGKDASRTQYLSMVRAMNHGSNAFNGFADGYDSKRKKK